VDKYSCNKILKFDVELRVKGSTQVPGYRFFYISVGFVTKFEKIIDHESGGIQGPSWGCLMNKFRSLKSRDAVTLCTPLFLALQNWCKNFVALCD
jgi:hypothetical protein